MARKPHSPSPAGLLFLFFLVSGFCSLAYEVVWLRLAYAAFGINTAVMSVVISVFMAGLALGSWLGGAWITRLARNRSALFFYAGAEAAIGAGAFAVPALFDASRNLLLAAGPADSFPYLALSALLLALSLLPFCFAMGATFPFALACLRRPDGGRGGGFGFLYLANVIGAMFGAATTALFWVELAGFRGTLAIASCLNFTVSVIAALSAWRLPRTVTGTIAGPRAVTGGRNAGWAFPAALFMTGLSSMGMEVAWVRNFTAVLGNQIYSFAWLLATYLLATWLGSALYRREIAGKAPARTPAILAGWAGLSALLPVLANDPRFDPGSLRVLLSIMPFCFVLGYLTPNLVDSWSGGEPARAGRAYAFNIVGCILGPLLASYLLLPLGGVQLTIALLAAPLLALSALMAEPGRRRLTRTLLLGSGTLALVLSVYPFGSFDSLGYRADPPFEVHRDHTATVVACGKGMERSLFVNGIGLTAMTPLTKVMAHLPLFCLPRRPERGLVICFGMGTTFRSMASWDIDTTGVELVPGVAKSFAFFHPDGPVLLADPRFRIVVDDGRRHLMRSRGRYDVITIDPPPPVEAAGTSLLYSREFYELVKSRLARGGILQQWFPRGEMASGQATLRAMTDVFPHVRAFVSIAGWGVHFLASMDPIVIPSEATIRARMPRKALEDLLEWRPLSNLARFRADLDRLELLVPGLLNPDPDIVLTDDRPYNEYYLVRRFLRKLFGERELPLMGK